MNTTRVEYRLDKRGSDQGCYIIYTRLNYTKYGHVDFQCIAIEYWSSQLASDTKRHVYSTVMPFEYLKLHVLKQSYHASG